VGNLFFFKYFYFFSRVLFDLTGYPFFKDVPLHIQIALPLAVSFYTFQMIAYTVDLYKEKETKLRPFEEYLSFIVFLPILIAGPILRKTDYFPQIENGIKPNKDQIQRACYLMMSGLTKKILLADPLMTVLSPLYSEPTHFSGGMIVLSGIVYVLQVYLDFSGLSDMARSLGLFLGFELPENFGAPFFATSLRELWTRWHISLSQWLRDYIYFPLGGSKVADSKVYRNLVVTMAIGGFWHGADYTFVTWGVYLGLMLCLERYLEKARGYNLTPDSFGIFFIFKASLVFMIFAISGIMFRSESGTKMVQALMGIFSQGNLSFYSLLNHEGYFWLAEGMDFIKPGYFSLNSLTGYERIGAVFLFTFFFHYIQYKPENMSVFRKYDSILIPILGVGLALSLAIASQDGGEFIYFKF
jgi:D-alanyl-lipoteichoic acid acyltransferase DltB (MBOAT superfamily)